MGGAGEMNASPIGFQPMQAYAKEKKRSRKESSHFKQRGGEWVSDRLARGEKTEIQKEEGPQSFPKMNK